jgi:hypothetical protein
MRLRRRVHACQALPMAHPSSCGAEVYWNDSQLLLLWADQTSKGNYTDANRADPKFANPKARISIPKHNDHQVQKLLESSISGCERTLARSCPSPLPRQGLKGRSRKRGRGKIEGSMDQIITLLTNLFNLTKVASVTLPGLLAAGGLALVLCAPARKATLPAFAARSRGHWDFVSR